MNDENYEEQIQGILETPLLTSMCSGYEGMGRGLRGIFPNLREIAYVEREGYACRTWSQRLKRVNWLRHLSLRMLKSSHTESSVDAWTSYLRDSLASPSHRQAFGKELKTQGICSPSSQMELMLAVPTGSPSKMSKESSAVSSVASRTQAFSNMSWDEWKKLP